jgi:hypothetical protein
MLYKRMYKLLTGALILILHLPVIAYVLWLHPQMVERESILDLPFHELLLALFLGALPYALILNRFAPGWNPERARLGEYEP